MRLIPSSRSAWLLLAATGSSALAASLARSPGRCALQAAAADFRRRYHRALADPQLARNLLAFQRAWRSARAVAFAQLGDTWAALPADTTPPPAFRPPRGDGEAVFAVLRDEMAAAKDAVIADLPDYFARFRAAAAAAGATVVEAVDAAAACAYVADVARRRGARLVVKSKSMVGEEIELNHHLEAHGIEVVETDLGEWIVQLAGERPSHMVMPAIHKSRQQVGALFSRVLGRAVSREAIPEQVAVARAELRRKFLEADVGISGANALIAETGTVMLVTNEGNGRLVTTLPPVHVVLVGYEKLVPSYADAMRQLRLLARSATAQPITSYTTFITGPDRPDKELHIVFVDNGRLRMRLDPEFHEALRCIRCGACANVCPPYQVVGGHVFGYIYTGAIGLVNTPFHHGLDHAAGPQSLCVSCNACATVCPVRIPLPRQILSVRARAAERLGLPVWKRAALALWARPSLADAACRIAAHLAAPLATGPFLRAPLPAAWRWRTPPALARVPARDQLRGRQTAPRAKREPGAAPSRDLPAAAARPPSPTVACFLQCLTDRCCPEVAMATVRVLEASGARVAVPPRQHCCGLPALDAGELATARRMARQTIAALEAAAADYVVTAAPSCVVAIREEYPSLFADEPRWQRRARALGARTLDLATYLREVARVGAPRSHTAAAPSPAGGRQVAVYHPFCQSLNVLGLPAEPRDLLADLPGVELRSLPEANTCCGFGGSTSFEHPAVARQIAARKLANVAATGATLLVTDNPGCLLHLRGAADAAGMPLRVVHLAELLAEDLRSGEPAGDKP
ncbi:MAG TPA: LUD domain-containing protein [Chloroflexota bacterium]|nr:LUD domain-containing protein [Chloroflexota bacterium]